MNIQNVRKNSNDYLLRRYLLYPDQKPEVAKSDKLAIAIPRNFTRNIEMSARNSTWVAQDQRDTGNRVGFIRNRFNANITFLQQRLIKDGVVQSKKKLIDKNYNLAKVAIFLVLKSRHSNKFLFVIRHNKTILNDVLALGFMTSLSFKGMVASCDTNYKRNLSRQNIIWRLGLDESIQNMQIHLNKIVLTGERGEFKQVPSFYEKLVKLIGILGGGKDIGIVYILEMDPPSLERIAVEVGGVVHDLDDFSYREVSKHYGLGCDGWSEALLKFFGS